MADLFPDTLPPPVSLKTRSPPVEDSVQVLAKRQPGWKAGAWWYAIEVLNEAQIMITGDVPIGFKADGSHKWARGADAKPCRVVVPRSEYHEFMDACKRAQGEQ